NNNVDVLCAFEVRMRQHHLGFAQQLMPQCKLRLFSPLHDSRTHVNSLLLVTKKTASERFKILHVDKEAKWIFLETAINSHPTTIAFVHAPATHDRVEREMFWQNFRCVVDDEKKQRLAVLG